MKPHRWTETSNDLLNRIDFIRRRQNKQVCMTWVDWVQKEYGHTHIHWRLAEILMRDWIIGLDFVMGNVSRFKWRYVRHEFALLFFSIDKIRDLVNVIVQQNIFCSTPIFHLSFPISIHKKMCCTDISWAYGKMNVLKFWADKEKKNLWIKVNSIDWATVWIL